MFDTKIGFTIDLAKNKIDGLKHYVENENKKGKRLFGGIITNTDQKDYKGRWLYFDLSSDKLRKSNFDNWKELI